MDRRSASVMEPPARPGESPYSSKIIKAGALLPDTKTLLSHWDTAATVEENLGRIRRENVFGKASRSRVEDILAIFRQRYLADEEVVKALVVLVQERLPAASLDRILYFHAAQSDRLLHDVVTEWLVPLQGRGIADIDVDEVQRLLSKWVAEGKTSGEWSEDTTRQGRPGAPLDAAGLRRAPGGRQQADRPGLPAGRRPSPTSCSTSSSTSPRGPSWSSTPTGGCSSCPVRASSGSCSRPTSGACWSTMRRAASPG